MSPGATFERVYNELKRMLAEGELPPGTPIEPALIGKQIAASITPIRDALHRLTGERLVEAPNHNGFRVPQLTEAALRDLYDWNGRLLGLAARTARSPATGGVAISAPLWEDMTAATARLFIDIARPTRSREHIEAVVRISSRLAPFRQIEAQLFADLADEYSLLLRAHADGDRRTLALLITRYHRRRTHAVSQILAVLRQG